MQTKVEQAMEHPRLVRVWQSFERPEVGDVDAAVRGELARLDVAGQVHEGESVAIAVGSRGIASLASALAAVVATVKNAGGRPFIVPAMGSHGGGTAEGQMATLAQYGITDAGVGAPVHATTDTVQLGVTEDGVPVLFDRMAAEADHLVVVNRVKPHTVLSGPVGSGPTKMLLIGLGNPEGARVYHRAFADLSFERLVETAVPLVLEKTHLLCALALVENGYHDLARVEAVSPAELVSREAELLAEAVRLMPRLPFDRCHLLVIDWIGKDISGSGLDTNVVGRGKAGPNCLRILARDLTPASAGNGIGTGIVDFVTRRLVSKVDPAVTYVNCSTSLSLRSGTIPFVFDTDRQGIEAALDTIGLTPPERARVIWIRDTADLECVRVSEAYADEIAERDDLEIDGEPLPWPFDEDGNLESPFAPYE